MNAWRKKIILLVLCGIPVAGLFASDIHATRPVKKPALVYQYTRMRPHMLAKLRANPTLRELTSSALYAKLDPPAK